MFFITIAAGSIIVNYTYVLHTSIRGLKFNQISVLKICLLFKIQNINIFTMNILKQCLTKAQLNFFIFDFEQRVKCLEFRFYNNMLLLCVCRHIMNQKICIVYQHQK